MTVAARVRSPVTPALRDIQAPVRRRLDSVADEMRRIVLADAPLIARVGSHLMSMKGKMLRPTLVLLSSDVDGASDERATPLAAVVELVHLATLVHDDAVDHSVLRRGLPTVNAAFSHQVSVIAGDFVYARALMELVTLGDLEPIAILTRATSEMTVGELRQLGAAEALSFSEKDYLVLIEAKTASLMAAACEIGAVAGALRHRAALGRFGHALGMAFQIIDDVMDCTEQQATTGKPSGLDLRERKATLPLIAALPRMPRADRMEVERFFAGTDERDEDVARITNIIRGAGGVDYARARASSYAERAEEAIEEMPDTPAVTSLRRLVRYVTERHA